MPLLLAVDVSIGGSLQTALDRVFDFLPKLLAALAILIVGWIIARIIRAVIVRVLDRLKVDERIGSTKGGEYIKRFAPGGSVTRLLATIVYWVIFLGVISLALTALEITEVTDVVGAIYDYLPNVIAALVILIVAALAAGFLGTFIKKALGDEGMGRFLSQAVPVLVLVLASFMVLNQLKIADEIVTITYAALVGAVALAAAVAFGLGGREVAGKVLDEAYAKRNRSGGSS